jgi:hypothetical protein
MELALNVSWFVLAVGSYVVLVRRLANSSAKWACGPSRLQCVVALGCVLAILFPVISLTDDLHDMQAAVEESSSSSIIMKKCGASHQLTPVCTSHHLLYVVSSFATSVGWLMFGNTATQRTVQLLPGRWLTPPGRAPPSSSITAIS